MTNETNDQRTGDAAAILAELMDAVDALAESWRGEADTYRDRRQFAAADAIGTAALQASDTVAALRTRVAAGQTRQAPRESTIVPVNDSGYKVKGDWIDITSETNTFPALNEVSVETCSLTHTDGFGREHTVPYGAHRVKAPGKRARTFKGETAWMDAERLAGDWQSEINQEKRKW